MKSIIKNKMKISVLLIVMLCCFVSCGNSADTTSSAGPESTAAKNTAVKTTESVSQEIAEVVTTESVSPNDTSEQLTQQTEHPTATPTEHATEQPTSQITSEEESMSTPAKLLYQGHASVRIQTPEGKTIYVDPFFGTGYDVPADLILMTHGHYDHTQTDLITSKVDDVKRRIVGGGFGGLFSANSPTARRFHPGECGLSAEIWRTSSGGRKRTRGLISAEEAPLLK